jgi:two-component system OmpR family response regulator
MAKAGCWRSLYRVLDGHALCQISGTCKKKNRDRQLMREAAELVVDDNTITSHMKRIRKKICGWNWVYDQIKGVYRMGYI